MGSLGQVVLALSSAYILYPLYHLKHPSPIAGEEAVAERDEITVL